MYSSVPVFDIKFNKHMVKGSQRNSGTTEVAHYNHTNADVDDLPRAATNITPTPALISTADAYNRRHAHTDTTDARCILY